MEDYKIITGLLTVIITILIYFTFRKDWNPRYLSMLKNVPCPNHTFFFGVALDFQAGQEASFRLARELAKECPKLYQAWIINSVVINIVHPDGAKELLNSTKNITKGFIYLMLHPWLQTGLLTSTGSKWHHRRKLLTPAFHFSILQQFTNVFAEQSFKIVEQIKKCIPNSPVNITEYVTEFALHSISETAMGCSQEQTETELKSYKESLYRFGEMGLYRVFRPWYHNDTIFNLSPNGFKNKKYVSNLHSFTRRVIKTRMEGFDNSNVMKNIDENNIDVNSKKRLAMLDLLISQKLNGADIDDEGIAEEVDTFMFEGHDTTSAAMSFALMLLANNKDCQDRVYEEIISIMGEDRNTLPTYNDLQEMTYLERCIKESLRLYPPVWFVGRKLEEDLKIDEFTLPAGVEIFLHIYDVHRHPDFWPNPDVFDPDRFLPENAQKRHPFAFIPFSAGPRNCIGQKFALLEEKALISTILRHFILEPIDTPETIKLIADMVIRPTKPLKIKMSPRL